MEKRFAGAVLMVVFAILQTGLMAQTTSNSGYYQQGKVIEGLSMRSELGKRNVNYAIYLPPGYDESARRYPVVYLLHGYSDNETAWLQFGEVNATADRAIANREIPPMIIVMPDAGVSFYINAQDSSNPFEDIMITEFVPFIDRTYRTRNNREYRAVSGLSMGGYGSLIYALKHPDMFSACAAFSSAVFTDDEIKAMPVDNYNLLFGKLFRVDPDGNRITEYWKSHSIINLMQSLPPDQIKRVRFYIDNGDDDFLFEGNAMLHIAMRKQGIPHQFRVRDGDHNWTYWRNNISEGLKFIGAGFKRQ